MIAFYLWAWNSNYLLRCSMFEVSAEAFVILMVPLMIAITFIDKYLGMRSSCPRDHSLLVYDDDGGYHPHEFPRRPPFWRYFFQAFVRAAMLEESTKYLAVRRIAFKHYVPKRCDRTFAPSPRTETSVPLVPLTAVTTSQVVCARSLLAYGALAGCVFGVVENINYGLMGGISTIFVRGFITVPFHTLTGVMQACMLSTASNAHHTFREIVAGETREHRSFRRW